MERLIYKNDYRKAITENIKKQKNVYMLKYILQISEICKWWNGEKLSQRDVNLFFAIKELLDCKDEDTIDFVHCFLRAREEKHGRKN